MAPEEGPRRRRKHGLDDLSAFGPDQLASDMDSFLGDGGVFAKAKTTKYFDGVWQDDPARIVKYRPSILHAYGWLPGIIWRNWKATVFSDLYLVGQIVFMCLWCLVIELTAQLWTDDIDVQTFLKFFGTPYMGAVVNLCMLITFILGLFVTLVINRWWEVRVQYGMVRSLSIEVSHIIVSNLRSTRSATSPEQRAEQAAQNALARSEMIRYLNFAHLLLLTDAQSKETSEYALSPAQKLTRFLRRCLSRVPVLRHFLRFEEVNTHLGDVLGNPKQLMSNLQSATKEVFKGTADAFGDIGRALKGERLEDLVDMEDMTDADVKEMDFQSYFRMGLVTKGEWELIKQQENDGVQAWRTVYTWAAALLAEAVSNARMEDRLGPAASIHAMLMEIRNAGGRIFTMIGSQLPFTYVHLVSFVCHVFLLVLSTYFGFALNSGIPPVHYDVAVNPTPNTAGVVNAPAGCLFNPAAKSVFNATSCIVGQVFSKRSGGLFNKLTDTNLPGDDWWLFRLQIYLFIVFSNALVQGLLSMHALLENPFGQHPGKFPLRAYAIDHIRQTRAMLKDASEREPETMRDIFKEPPPVRSVASRAGNLASLAAAAAASSSAKSPPAAAVREGEAVAVPVDDERAPLLQTDHEDDAARSML